MRMEFLRERTKQYGLRVINLFAALPKLKQAEVIGLQLLRSGTSVASNFREGSRARSDAEFISKLGTVEQELDESLLWLEYLVDAKIMKASRLAPLMDETEQLLKIIVTAIRKTKSRRDR